MKLSSAAFGKLANIKKYYNIPFNLRCKVLDACVLLPDNELLAIERAIEG